MAIYSNILAWETPWIEEPCRGWSMGVTRVRHAKAFDYVDHNKLWKILKEIGIPPYTCLLRKLNETMYPEGKKTFQRQTGLSLEHRSQ